MARGRPVVFLQPGLYRRRRLIDAARLLPVFGTFLMVVPLLLLPSGEVGATSSVLIYLFLLWTLLIILAAWIARHMKNDTPAQPPSDVDVRDGPS